VPEAEIPKEHLYAVNKNHQIHDFQITCSIRFSFSDLSVGVRAVSQIAIALAVRESAFVVIFDGDVHFSPVGPCIYKTQTTSVGGIQIAQPE